MTWKTTMRRVGNKGIQTTIPTKIIELLGKGDVKWTYENGKIYVEVEEKLGGN